jgi:hypothetical protein
MAKKVAVVMPEGLRYLQPFLKSLAKLAPEKLNEDVDISRLETALRKRLKGMDEAEAALEDDCRLLDAWLAAEGKENAAAQWVRGFLAFGDLAKHMVRPPEPVDPGPTIHFDPLPGWRVKKFAYRIEVQKGKVFASITVTDEFGHRSDQLLFNRWAPLPHMNSALATSEIRCGDVVGMKYVIQEVGQKKSMKSITYTLKVPGGYVRITAGHTGLADFDESFVESQLQTLRLSNESNQQS